MPRGLFVELYGDVFEHTPQIAEAAHRRGLGAACDTAQGLHAALCAALRDSDEALKLSLIRAHPDLAGRLALAGKLTEDSTREQASSGLDRLTPQELARFTTLNDGYKARFGFPFIMAVKGATKQQILEAFERRLQHHPEGEFAEALAQIEKIALLRLKDRLPEGAP
jgi:OHCU decarboxylase